jgi:hypothetical protein
MTERCDGLVVDDELGDGCMAGTLEGRVALVDIGEEERLDAAAGRAEP